MPIQRKVPELRGRLTAEEDRIRQIEGAIKGRSGNSTVRSLGGGTVSYWKKKLADHKKARDNIKRELDAFGPGGEREEAFREQNRLRGEQGSLRERLAYLEGEGGRREFKGRRNTLQSKINEVRGQLRDVESQIGEWEPIVNPPGQAPYSGAPGGVTFGRRPPPKPAPKPGDVRVMEQTAPAAPKAPGAPAAPPKAPAAPTEGLGDFDLFGAGAGDAGTGGGETTAAPVYEPSIPALRAGAPDAEVRDHVRRHFGYLSWALDIGELAGIVRRIAENPSGVTKESVMGELSNTKWWKLNGQNAATWLRRRNEDPATTQREIRDRYEELSVSAKEAGIDLPVERLWKIAEESLKWNWSQATLQNVLGSEYKYDPSKPTATTKRLKQMTNDYLVPMGDTALGIWVKQIIQGTQTEESFRQYLTGMAKSMFPHMAAALDRGDTVEQYTSVFREHAAKTLEVDPESINWTDPKWMKTLTSVDPKTGERKAMDFAQFDRLLRTDPAYGYEYTKQAKDDAMSLGSALLRRMGAVA